MEIVRNHRVSNQGSAVGGGWQLFSVSPETAGWLRKCEKGHCLGEVARSVRTKVRGDVFASYHVVAAKIAVEPVLHSLASWKRCFALPQLLYRRLHQTGLFWVPPRTLGTRWLVVEALRYKPQGRRIDSRWCHWIFSLTWSFRSHYGPGVDSASNRNEYQKYFLEVKVAGS
jgi:hypothetical protein